MSAVWLVVEWLRKPTLSLTLAFSFASKRVVQPSMSYSALFEAKLNAKVRLKVGFLSHTTTRVGIVDLLHDSTDQFADTSEML